MQISDINPHIRLAERFIYKPRINPVYTRDSRILYICGGNGSVIVDNCEYKLFPGSLFYCPGGTVYRISSDEEIELYCINFDMTQRKSHITSVVPLVEKGSKENPTVIDPCKFEDSNVLNGYYVTENATELEGLLKEITEEFTTQKPYYREASSALLKKLIITLHRQKLVKSRKTSETVNKIAEYINQNFEKTISNEHVAKMLGYHQYYLNRIFIKHTGKSIHRFLLSTRINHAKKLLLNTDLSVGEISFKVGFNSTSHFSSYFKKEFGVTPAEYRNKFLV